MSVISDPIADMLTRIRNALQVGHRRVVVPDSKIKIRLAEILQEEGYIEGFQKVEHSAHRALELELKYDSNGRAAIEGLKRISRPGRRVYTNSRGIPRIRNGLGIAVISTSQGVMTDAKARATQTGGEILCYVW